MSMRRCGKSQAFLLAVVVGCSTPEERIDRGKVHSIKAGMTRSEVYQLCPPSSPPIAPAIMSIPITTWAEMHPMPNGVFLPISYEYRKYHFEKHASIDDVLFGCKGIGTAVKNSDDVVVKVGKPIAQTTAPNQTTECSQ